MNRWVLGIGVALFVFGPSCADNAGTREDETHFQACKKQSDCADAGDATICESGRCRPPRSASRASGGASGVPCDDGTLTPPDNPADRSCYSTAGNAGALGYPTCPSLERIAEVDCGPGPEPDGKDALAGWCAHIGGVPMMSFLAQQVAFCMAPRFLTGVPGQQLNTEAVCSAELRDALRQCGDALKPCPQPPLCVEGGVWGCDEIRSGCAALSADACRAGLDSRNYAGRMAIHDCITSAPASDDCVATFYRCVWGL